VPAAATIAPLLGALAERLPAAPFAPPAGDAFGQALQAVRDAVSGPRADVAANNDAQPAPAGLDPATPVGLADLDPATPAGPKVSAGQFWAAVATLASRSTGRRGAAPPDRPTRAGRDDGGTHDPRSVGPATATPVYAPMPAQDVVAVSCLVSGRRTGPPTVAHDQTAGSDQAARSGQTAPIGQTGAVGETGTIRQAGAVGPTAVNDPTTVSGQTAVSQPTVASSPTVTWQQSDPAGQTASGCQIGAPDRTAESRQTAQSRQTAAPGPTTSSDQATASGETTASDQAAPPGQPAASPSTTTSDQIVRSSQTAAFDLDGASNQHPASRQTSGSNQTTAPGRTVTPGQATVLGQGAARDAGPDIEANPDQEARLVRAVAAKQAPEAAETVAPATDPDTGWMAVRTSAAAAVPAGVETAGPRPDVIPAHGAGPAQAVSAPAALQAALTRPIQEPRAPAAVPIQATDARPVGRFASDPVHSAFVEAATSPVPTGSEAHDASGHNRDKPLPDPRQPTDRSDQSRPASADPGAPPQHPLAASVVASGQTSTSTLRPSTAASSANTASSASAAMAATSPPALAPATPSTTTDLGMPAAPVPVAVAVPPPAAIPDAGPGQIPVAVATSDHKATPHLLEADASPTQPGTTPGTPLEQAVSGAEPAATPTATPATASIAASPPAHHATAAEQVTPALLSLARTAGGSQQITVRLQPGELGMVQVRIARAVSGTTQIDVTAESPTTLLALQRDQPQLHRTLDAAGIPAAGRTIAFHLVPTAQAAANGNSPGSLPSHGGSPTGSASRSQIGTVDADGSSGGRDGHLAQERNIYSTSRRPSPAPTAADRMPGASAAPPVRSNRIGLDITA
jgi:hypothetical protein